MTVPEKKGYVHILKFICIHCDRPREVQIHEGMGITKGQVIMPYAGGGNWGRCLFCRKAGLRATEEIPRKKKEPVGWRRK